MIVVVATLHLMFACYAQGNNRISSLDGAVFPAGLTELELVSFHHCRLCFVVCVYVMCDACAVRMLRD